MIRMRKFFLYLFALASVLVMPFGAAETADIDPGHLLGAWINPLPGGGNCSMLQFFDDGTVAVIPIAYPSGRSPECVGALWA
ncbi:MAG: hypothetical protein LBU26_03270, partial [Synergistaceae bacterium]|nr:hypothetical protein [Synergistaceae bacterium]